MVDRYLDTSASNWAAFDPELGYKLRDNFIRDGIDGSYTISHYDSSGRRRMIHFADRPCRINTYGDSFTQCHQVSDGETWQEYLAAHIGEPIRNFGVGGYGVLHACRRMEKEEKTAASGEYILLNVYSDDHVRNIDRWWSWLGTRESVRNRIRNGLSSPEVWMFHGVPWPYLRLTKDTGTFQEFENEYSTPESLYLLCDPDHVYESFKDEFTVQVHLAEQHAEDVKTEVLQDIADILEVRADLGSPAAVAHTARRLHRSVALRSSIHIVDRARAFAQAEGKSLKVVLSYASREVVRACDGEPRFDQLFVEYLEDNDLLLADTLHSHLSDFEHFRCPAEEYVGRYYIGHYSPTGNHFFAFAVKGPVVQWLKPKPPTYGSEESGFQQALAGDLA